MLGTLGRDAVESADPPARAAALRSCSLRGRGMFVWFVGKIDNLGGFYRLSKRRNGCLVVIWLVAKPAAHPHHLLSGGFGIAQDWKTRLQNCLETALQHQSPKKKPFKKASTYPGVMLRTTIQDLRQTPFVVELVTASDLHSGGLGFAHQGLRRAPTGQHLGLHRHRS